MVENFFHYCYYAFLMGDLKKARMYFSFLRDAFKEGGSRESLRDDQWRQLKDIRTAIESGSLPTSRWVTEPVFVPQEKKEKARIHQDELARRIHCEGLEMLKEILGQDVYLYNIEHPCPPYGNVDMVYTGKDTAYPVELKKDRGEHDILGQILKYDLFFRLRLHLKHYQKVQAVTICGSYSRFTLQELKKMGVETLRYSTSGSSLKLTAV